MTANIQTETLLPYAMYLCAEDSTIIDSMIVLARNDNHAEDIASDNLGDDIYYFEIALATSQELETMFWANDCAHLRSTYIDCANTVSQVVEIMNWSFNKNTNHNGLQGIYSATQGEVPCATRHLKAINLEGEIVAYVQWETLGNQYRYAQRKFGDQLEKAGFSRMGY